MARFNFRLQQYLGIKKQLEDQKELEYAKALRMLEAERKKLAELKNRRNESVETLRAIVSTKITPFEIRRFNNNIERLKQLIATQKERVAAAEAYAEQKRQDLVQAMKERKAIETVKEHQHEEFVKESELIERKQVDELVSFKAASRPPVLDESSS